MSSAIVDYFEALERLKKNKPERVPRGIKITNDSVALEAGRSKGSIKKSRGVFVKLIEAINEAAKEQNKPKVTEKEKATKAKIKTEYYRTRYEEALGREVMLIKRVYELEEELAKLTHNKIENLETPT